MNELPNGWAAAVLSDLGASGEQTVLTGPFGANLGKEDFIASGVPVFTIGCLGADRIERSKLLHVSPVKAAELATYRLREGDFLFSRMASVGRAGFVPTDLNGALFNYHLMRLRLDSDIVLPQLFYYFVRGSELVRAYLDDVSRGATRDGINTKLLRNMPVHVPPQAEQQRIVTKIDSLSAKSRRARDHLDHIPRLVEKYKQAILTAAFRGEMAHMPTGRAQPLSSVVLLRTGPFGSALHKSDYVFGGVPLVNPMHIVGGSIVVQRETSITEEKARSLAEFRLRDGDVVLARRGVMGRCAVVTSREAGFVCGTGSMIVRPSKDVLPHYLQRYLSSPDVVAALEEGAVGTTMVNLNQSILLRQQIPLSSVEEQREAVERIDAALAWIDRLAGEATSARRLIDRFDQAVLAKAFRGELVPQVPTDEPASVLLERVRAERQEAAKIERKRRVKAET